MDTANMEGHGRHCLQEVERNLFYRACTEDHEVRGMLRFTTGLYFTELDWNFKVGFKPEEVYYVLDGTPLATDIKARRKRYRRALTAEEKKKRNKHKKMKRKLKKKIGYSDKIK